MSIIATSTLEPQGIECLDPVELLARLREQSAVMDRTIFDLKALLKAGEALHGHLDVDELCKLFLAMIRERVGVRHLAVMLHDEAGAVVRLEACHGLSFEGEQPFFDVQDGVLWRLLLAGDPFSVVDLRGHARFPGIFTRHELDALKGVTWLPLSTPGEVIGLVSLGLTGDGRPVPERELPFLAGLAGQAAAALAKARMYGRITIARRELDRSLRNLNILFDTTRALSAVADLTRLLQMILDGAIEAVQAEKGSLMLLDEALDELVIRVVRGLPDQDIERKINEGLIECTRLGRGEGVAGKVLQTGEAVRVDDVGASEDFAHRAESPFVHSLLCVPLVVDDEVIGVLNISNHQGEGPFGSEDEELLLAVAGQAAVAIARTRLYQAAITDGLTGLFNRRYTMHRLSAELRRTRRYGGKLSILLCDIDHFKRVNDEHGHPAGDEVLRRVTDYLGQGLRVDVDVVGRYGGEEFLVVLPATDGPSACIVAERIRASISAEPIPLGDGGALPITLSLGVAQFDPERDDGVDALIKRADEALYQAKDEGRNRIRGDGC